MNQPACVHSDTVMRSSLICWLTTVTHNSDNKAQFGLFYKLQTSLLVLAAYIYSYILYYMYVSGGKGT